MSSRLYFGLLWSTGVHMHLVQRDKRHLQPKRLLPEYTFYTFDIIDIKFVKSKHDHSNIVLNAYCGGSPILPPVFKSVILPNITSISSVAILTCADGYVNGSDGWPKFTCVANTSTIGFWNASGECDRTKQHKIKNFMAVAIYRKRYVLERNV